MLPEARQEKLLVEEVGEELVVYDQERHRAHRLNPTAALLWRHCDGQTSVAELAALLAREPSPAAAEEVVRLGLKQLEKVHLLRTRAAEGVGVSRREMGRRLALAGALSILLPVVSSIVAPTPAMALHSPGHGGPGCGNGGLGQCVDGGECPDGCFTGTGECPEGQSCCIGCGVICSC